MKKRFLTLVLMVTMTVSMLALCGCTSKQDTMSDCIRSGKELMSQGDYAGAVQVFDNGLEASNGTITDEVMDLVYYKAAALFQEGSYDEAIDCYTALMKYDEDDGYPAFLRG